MSWLKKCTNTACILVIIAIIIALYYIFVNYEQFVVVPGEVSDATCLASCADDSQCLTSLYNEGKKQCIVSKELEIPEKDEVGYTKLDAQNNPRTFIRSDSQDRVNSDVLGGEGIPIDWTQDSTMEQHESQAEFDVMYNDFINKREYDDINFGFSDVDTVYTAGTIESMSALDDNQYNISGPRITKKKKKNKCKYNLTLPACFQKCKDNKKCKSITWDPSTGNCCFKSKKINK